MNVFLRSEVILKIPNVVRRGLSDYLHHSKLPTYHFQQCLPRLPIPKLEDTVQKYLLSLKALEGHPDVSAESISGTERASKLFLSGDGLNLHKLLVERNSRNKNTSYITEPWFDMYLKSRLPLPLNYNPFLVFKRDPNESMNDPATRSTNMIISALRFKSTLDAEVLSPEVFYLKDTAKSPAVQTLVKYLPNAFMLRYLPMMFGGAYPLDMSQFKNLFSSTRIPVQDKDQLVTFPQSRHIVVIRNGHFFKVNVLDMFGNTLNPLTIRASVEGILHQQLPKNDDSVAYLATNERNTWAEVREHMIKQGNKESLEAVDSAIFCVVFDDSKNAGTPDGAVDTFLHGDGSSRWFDKSFSLIFSADGEVGLTFEHAWGDGVAVMRFFNEVFDDSTMNPALNNDTETDNVDVTNSLSQISFHLDDFTKQAISDARSRYRHATSSLRKASCEFPQLNKDYLKRKKVSPDGIMQLAIQIGHYKLCGHPAATYESCSTSAFKHGRTETIRSCTLEAQAVAQAVASGTTSTVNNRLVSDAEFRAKVEDLIRKSCKKHNELTKDAAMGLGFDRHLFGLKNLAENVLDSPTPSFYRDPSYKTMNHIVLSTSTLSSHAVSIGGFAPVVPEGFGVGYGVRDEMVGCNITSYESRDVVGLVDAIKSGLVDIFTVLESSKVD